MAVQIRAVVTDSDWRAARGLVEEYVGALDVDLSFQHISEELEHLSVEYGPPRGAFVIAEDDGALLGCVGLRPLGPTGVAEMKRLYTTPEARGLGIGRQLVEAIIDVARARGYRRLVLDTLPFMTAAQSLYGSLGFRPTTAYRFNPVPGASFFECDL
jgi:GNAT superfamily N-acetyltransferase